jgi:hypothetical protein
VIQNVEGVAKDRFRALNYERLRRVISSAKHNLRKTLIAELCIRTLSIKLFVCAFLHNNHIGCTFNRIGAL